MIEKNAAISNASHKSVLLENDNIQLLLSDFYPDLVVSKSSIILDILKHITSDLLEQRKLNQNVSIEVTNTVLANMSHVPNEDFSLHKIIEEKNQNIQKTQKQLYNAQSELENHANLQISLNLLESKYIDAQFAIKQLCSDINSLRVSERNSMRIRQKLQKELQEIRNELRITITDKISLQNLSSELKNTLIKITENNKAKVGFDYIVFFTVYHVCFFVAKLADTSN